ncbi:hypothetical protein C8R43DRAFT_944646 [Mycena crocata]|nr:hypothetical protein C8R43DRAFT_944646 [Mycena crocata]
MSRDASTQTPTSGVPTRTLPAAMDEDIVPDSEDEDMLQPLNPVQTTTSPQAAPAPTTDSISSFAVKPGNAGAPPVRERPRPKPAFKGAPGVAGRVDTSVIESDFSDPLQSSLSDRIKMRKREASKTKAAPLPASTSALSSRRKAAISSEVIEIDDSGSEDELNSHTKRKAASASSNVLPALNPISITSIPFPFLPSPLPPSDPFPQSTATTRYHPEHEEVPPIATLGPTEDTSFDYHLSPSPSALAHRKEQPKPKLKIKLKKPKPPAPDYRDDQLFYGEQEIGRDIDARMMPPLHIPNMPMIPSDVGTSSSSTGPALDTPVDLAVPADGPPKPPKKSRKKKDGDGGEKPAKKPRAKKAKKDAEGGDGAPDKPKKKKGKAKEKEKEEFKSAEFIVDDDDDEPMLPVDGVPLPHQSAMDVDLSSGGPSGDNPISIVSIPDSQPDEELVPLIGEKRKRVVDEEIEVVPVSEKAPPAAKKTKMAKSGSVAVEKIRKGPAKKAKGRTIMSDDDDEDSVGNDTSIPVESAIADAGGIEPERQAAVSDSVGDEETQKKVKSGKKKSSKKTVVSESEAEENETSQNKPNENSSPRTSSKSQVENMPLDASRFNTSPKSQSFESTPKLALPSITSKYTLASRTKSTPMSELIRKVNSMPGSPFPVIAPRSRASFVVGAAGGSTPTYSPYNKFSRSALSRIAPLHPNRRTPPPPLPPPPPKPKTKKEKEREERWEEEMIEAVGGWDEWKLLSEQEQKAAKRAKWARELEACNSRIVASSCSMSYVPQHLSQPARNPFLPDPPKAESRPTTPCRLPTAHKRKEYTYDLLNKSEKPWATLELLGDTEYSKNIPAFLEGSPITGEVRLHLETGDAIHAVIISIKGRIITGATPSEMVCFLDLPTTLWSRSMGNPRNPGGEKWSEKLSGKYVWPFSISMPPTVSLSSGRRELEEVFRLPQTFFERHTRAQVEYEVAVRFTRTKLRSDYRLSTTVNYVPLIRPSPPSRLRQLAYQQHTALLGPDSDPEGWFTLPAVRTRGRLSSTSHSVDAKCRLSLATPLLASPDAVALRLRRNVRFHTGEKNSEDVTNKLVWKEELEHSELATWWPAADRASATESTDTIGINAFRRMLKGEIHLKADLATSSSMAHFRIEYSVVLFPFDAPGYESSDSEPLVDKSVEIASEYASGPRPLNYSSPSATGILFILYTVNLVPTV